MSSTASHPTVHPTLPAVTVGLLVCLEAREGREEEVNAFLEGGLAAVLDEPETVHWFATRLGTSTFGIFDTFGAESGRSAHLAGKVAAALLAKAPELLAAPPTIERLDVLATKTPAAGAGGQARKALLVRLAAKPGQEAAMEDFLVGGLSVVMDEPETMHWFAIRLDSSTFGIFDTFAADAGRDAHLAGKVAAALMASAPTLLAAAPDIAKLDVTAVKP